MTEATDASQGAPEGEAALSPAIETAQDTGTEQTQQTEGDGQQTTQEPDGDGDKPKKTPWWQKRIDDITREKWEARREAEAYRAALDSLNRGQQDQNPDPNQPAKALSPAEIDRLATEKAKEIAAAAKFNEDCNSVYEKGRDAFPDFEEALGNFRLLGGLRQEVIEAAMATGEAHKVLHQLGKNPDEAARVMNLPLPRMAVELAKLATAAPKAKPVSNAPPPVRPVDGGSRVLDDPERMSMDEWVAWRSKQLSKG